MSSLLKKSWPVLGALLLLAACGGGGGGTPTVSTMAATNLSYGRTMTVTVSGSALTQGEYTMIVEGPCGPVTRVAGGTDLQQQFACQVTGVGGLIPRIRTPNGVELASVFAQVPLPQVSMTVRQGERTGSFVVELDPGAAPATVNNFLAYVNSSFYTNVIFHRVVADFVAQAGGFTAGPTAKAPTRAPIALEAANGLKNLRGTIAMARSSDPSSATSQFFINLVDNPDLDVGSTTNPDGYAVFGRVASGQDIVDEIGKVPTRVHTSTGLTHLPVTNVVITAATQTR